MQWLRGSHLLSLVAFLLFAPLSSYGAITVPPGGERQMYTDVSEDIEPAVMSTSVSGADYTTTVFMKFLNIYSTVKPQLYYSSYNTNGQIRANPLPTLTGYDRNADPVMAKNTTTTWPTNRIYLAGTAYNATTPNAIAVWSSDDGGFTWSSPGAVVTENTSPYFLDKPAIAVSAETTSAGYVYIAYVRVNESTGLPESDFGQVNVMASPNGGLTWYGPYAVGTNQFWYTGPQVMVDSTTGKVYVLWTDLGHGNNGGQLHMASSPLWDPYRYGTYQPNNAMTFTEEAAPLATNVLLGGTVSDVIAPGAGVGLQARSIPVAKLDSAHGRISVAWHEAVPGETTTQIRFASRAVNGSWGTPITIASGGHPVMPAMDFDSSGNFLVTYYSFPAGSSNYTEAAAYVTFSGNTPTLSETNSSVSSFSSILTNYSMDDHGTRHLGEYQDVIFYNGSWHAAGIGIGTYGNPFIWTINHS